MSSRANFIAMIVVGLLIVLVSIFAHQLGIGTAGFGIKKIAGVAIGAIVVLGGMYAYMRQPATAAR